MNREEKSELIDALNRKFSSSKAVVFTNYKGLTVKEMNDLRSALRESNIEYQVIKNTLARIASHQTPVEVMKERFRGPIGVVIGYDDPALVPKKVFEYAKKNEKLIVSDGVVEGQLFSEEELKVISKLPSREVLLSQLAGAMSAPLSKLASLFNATINRFAYALSAVKEKKSQ